MSSRIGRKRESKPGKMLLSIIVGYAKRTTWLFEAPQNFPEVTRGYSSLFGKVPQTPSPYDTGEASKSETLSLLSNRLFQCCIASRVYPRMRKLFFATWSQHAAVPIYSKDPDTHRLKSFKPLFLLARKREGRVGQLGTIFRSSRNPGDIGRKPCGGQVDLPHLTLSPPSHHLCFMPQLIQQRF